MILKRNLKYVITSTIKDFNSGIQKNKITIIIIVVPNYLLNVYVAILIVWRYTQFLIID